MLCTDIRRALPCLALRQELLVYAGAIVSHHLAMDRWSGREDDDDNVKAGPQGRVARLGIGAFVKQDAGAINSVQDCFI